MSSAITAETLARPPAFWTRAKATARSRRQSCGAMVMAVLDDLSAGVDAAGARDLVDVFFAPPRTAPPCSYRRRQSDPLLATLEVSIHAPARGRLANIDRSAIDLKFRSTPP